MICPRQHVSVGIEREMIAISTLQIDDDVVGNAKEPTAKRRPFPAGIGLEPLECGDGLGEDDRGGIGRGVRVRQSPQAVVIDDGHVAFVQWGKCLRIDMGTSDDSEIIVSGVVDRHTVFPGCGLLVS